MAKKQIAQTGQKGSGMATAGIIIGAIISVLAVIALIATVANGGNSWTYNYGN